jgi:ATPase subunit of ABC transporter with duplicated ATPase domains
MAKLTRKQLDEEIKVRFLEGVSEHLSNVGEEVLRVGSNEIALPVVDTEGEERWLVLTFKVPTGSRDGDAYDGYSMKEDYEMKLQEKAAKAEAKAAKAEKDKAKRAKAEEATRAKAQADAKAIAEIP